MHNVRRNLLPPLLNTTESVREALNSIQYRSLNEENMILYNDLNSKLVIIGSKFYSDVLCKAEMLYVDSKFEYCAKHYIQLFTIVRGYLNGLYVPLAFSLLQNESNDT